MSIVGALVAYKNQAAEVIEQTHKKLIIRLPNDQEIKVGSKHVRVLHPNYQPPIIDQHPCDLSTLAELADSALSIAELCEWLFGCYDAHSAWQAQQLAQAKIYCYWYRDKIYIRNRQQALDILAKQQQAEQEQARLLASIARFQQNYYNADDLDYLAQVSDVAFKQKKYHKLLKALNIDNTPQAAYQWLVQLGYLTPDINPYPMRYHLPLDQVIPLPSVALIKRVDLTDLDSFAIDNPDCIDADDAISLTGNRVWIHIADPAEVITPDSVLDDYARTRAVSLYLPNEVRYMLPMQVTKALALRPPKSKALSIGFQLSDNEITHLEIIPSMIKVTQLSYTNAETLINQNTVLTKLYQLVRQHRLWRLANNAIQLDLPRVQLACQNGMVMLTQETRNKAKVLVAEAMIIVGRIIAQYAINCHISMPFAGQSAPDDDTISTQYERLPAEQFHLARQLRDTTMSHIPKKHASLGLDAYVRITSPLRRYLDLLAHQQLHRHLTAQSLLSDEHINERILAINRVLPQVNAVAKLSERHYKCLYMLQHPKWQGKGIVIDHRFLKAQISIPELALITKCYAKKRLVANQAVTVAIIKVDLAHLDMQFAIK